MRISLYPLLVYAALAVFSAAAFSCRKDHNGPAGESLLRFSEDTVLFDTVFTTIGSVTREFRVYNPGPAEVVVKAIRLGRGNDSEFRINVDGIPGPEISNYRLRSGDSAFIFVEVTINPLEENMPMVVQDSVVFLTSDNSWDVDLVAWGQDVHLLNGAIIQSQTWTNDKPYLIYNSMFLDTGQLLTIEPGVRIHFHRFSTFYVAGTLRVEGTLEQPVVFQGDRLEQIYSDVPGQWYGIYLLNGSGPHFMENVVVKNATSGIHLGNLFTPDPSPALELINARVEHMSYTGISSLGGTITARNVLVGNCGFYSLLLALGGSYEFLHCTIANHWGYSNRITPSVLLSNYYAISETQVLTSDLVRADFGNCIIDGRRDNELGLADVDDGTAFGYFFRSCYIRADSTVPIQNLAHFSGTITGENPGFESIAEYNYFLKPDALARNRGEETIALLVPFDIAGNSRLADEAPDPGAFETIPEQ